MLEPAKETMSVSRASNPDENVRVPLGPKLAQRMVTKTVVQGRTEKKEQVASVEFSEPIALVLMGKGVHLNKSQMKAYLKASPEEKAAYNVVCKNVRRMVREGAPRDREIVETIGDIPGAATVGVVLGAACVGAAGLFWFREYQDFQARKGMGDEE